MRPYIPLPQAGEGERAIGRTAVRPYIPLPQAGEGERAIGRTAVRPYTPLPLCGRGAGGEGNTKCASSARSELNRCTLIIPIAEPKFTKDSS